jgi:glycosyltransferase involved in cell wall biosynthesis
MKILFIAPLPPPVNGQSLQSKIFLDFLIKENEVFVINTIKNSHKDGIDSIKRIFEIFKILIVIFKKKKYVDVVYLQISESLAGNFRDLLIFLICWKKLQKMYIHLHGGSIKIWVYDKNEYLKSMNKFFIQKMRGVIVLGNSHVSIFNNMIDNSKIHVINNFAEDFLFSNPEKIVKKFSKTGKIKVLFLSNMILGKGHHELLGGYVKLSDTLKSQIQIDFAGAFSSKIEKIGFLNKLEKYENVKYHGIVSGLEKKNLLDNAHILCFPSYLFEGQGICLIEGYAAGCVGITTGKSGISDIFIDNINGFKIEEKSEDSVKSVLEEIVLKKGDLLNIAINNFKQAKQIYTVSNHCIKLSELLYN